MTKVPNCRFCGTPASTSLIDLGTMPLANSYASVAQPQNEPRFPLHVRVCPKCFLVQADASLPPDEIFSDYAYFSSYTDSWVEHARQYALAMIAALHLGQHALVVEIASNDGYLLQHFLAEGVPVLGVEPAANVAEVARAKGIATEVAFFGSAVAAKIAAAHGHADLIAANNVLAHVPDIADFLTGVGALLKADGVATFEFPHLLNLIADVQFDTIYHEHFSYLSLVCLDKVFDAVGLRAVDVETLTTHGGSLRLHAVKTTALRQASPRVDEMRLQEKAAGLDHLVGYQGFATRVGKVKAAFLSFLAKAKAEGKTVAAYGAAAKGNTFLNACGISANDIACVFDRSLAKQGKFLPGSHIPILSPDKLGEIKPDYLVILPWNLAEEIAAQMTSLRSWGGQFVTAVPNLRIF